MNSLMAIQEYDVNYLSRDFVSKRLRRKILILRNDQVRSLYLDR
jgi:hypothetical protein